VRLLFAIFQGAGFAVGVGIRPFLPALLVGCLASLNAGIDFSGTDYAFLESAGFLFALVALVFAATLAERRIGAERMEAGPLGAALTGLSLGLGAVLFAGALAAEGYTSWPGLPAGIACAAVSHAAVGPLLARTRARLDEHAARALPLYAEGTAIAVAGLSVPAPPVGIVALAFFAWLLVTGRRRGEKTYAGLRSLR